MSRLSRHYPDDPEMWANPPRLIAEWNYRVEKTAARCKCSHPESTHGTDRKGRLVCWSAACGCIAFREDTA